MLQSTGVLVLGKAASERSEQRAACGAAAPISESPEPPPMLEVPASPHATALPSTIASTLMKVGACGPRPVQISIASQR